MYANPDSGTMPAATRAQWLRDLYRGDEPGRRAAHRGHAAAHSGPHGRS
ncbi:hypothetical protein ACFQT0_15800 [Hymenobacter humi]|uniref:Uncharacterized protein n=1 Tax=Hymenobacter humi TaxID=1411620 RepID=A0ABW2U711_9BACT